ncbi:MAG: phage portal protein [Nanoarchaeota archaeon]|nr:phage portal protein [Nanoarchaeota archaeon]
MVEYITTEELNIRASSGIVKDYYKESHDNTVSSPTDYNLLLDMCESDPVLTTALDTTVDVGSAHGFRFLGKNNRTTKELQELFEDTLDFDLVSQNIMYSMLIYGDAFLEIRKLDGAPSELHVLETTEMKIQYDKHGEILGYIQTPISEPSSKVHFSVDDVVHFKLKSIGSRVYSYTPLKSIMRDYSTNKFANSYLANIFKNFPPRLLYVLKTANKEQTKMFIENLKRAKNTPHKDLVGWGEIETKETGVFDFSKGLVEILNHLRTSILMITKVPPIWIGIPDNSNRSNSEAQIRSFETRIKSVQNKIASAINKQLLPALGFSPKNVKFAFNSFSLMEEKSIMNNAKVMKDIGIDDDSVLDYILARGIKLREDAKIEKPEPMMGAGVPGEESEDGDSNRGADSNGEGRKTQLDQNGVSEAGKKKRESSVRSDLWTYDNLGVRE